MKYYYKYCYVLIFILCLSSKAFAEYEAKLFVNGQQTLTVESGKPMDWRLEIYDKVTKLKVTKFKRMFGKSMHMVVMSEDYSTYAHIHPKLLGVSGDFYLGVNQADDDFDSMGTLTAISKPGKYHVVVEVFPEQGTLIPVPSFVRFDVEAAGTAQKDVLKIEEMDAECFFTTYVTATNLPGNYGSKYRVRMYPQLVEGDSGTLIKFTYHIQNWDNSLQTYVPVAKLQPLMGMEGHMFLASIGARDNSLLGYSHLHGMVHVGHPGMMHLSYFDRGELLTKSNPTKFWLQFKHEERVYVAPITAKLNPHINHMCEAHH